MKLKSLFVAGLLAAGAASSYAAAGDVILTDAKFKFSNGVATIADEYSFAALTGATKYKWELAVAGTGKLSLSSVMFNAMPVSVLAGNSFAGSGTFDGSPFSFSVAGSSTGAGNYVASLTVTAVPEPETFALMFAGLGAVGFMARRRKMI